MTDATMAVVEAGNDRASQLEAQVERIRAASKDAIAHTQTLTVVDTLSITEALAPEQDGDAIPLGDRVTIMAPGGLKIAIADVAHDQFAEKLGIPKPYYQRMLATQPALLASNMNTWLKSEPEKRLLRMISPLDDSEAKRLAFTGAEYRLRAFLGAAYRPLDNAELVATVLPVMKEKGAYLADFSITDQRLHAKFLTVEKSVADIRDRVQRTNGALVGAHQFMNEIVRMGVYLRNSETGFASLDVAGLIEILKCLNGLIAPAQTKVRHVGSKKNGNGDGELQFLSTQTQRLDNAAIFSRVKDTAIAALDENAQVNYAERIITAKATILSPEQPVFEFIGRLGENLQLTEGETDVLKEEVVRSNVIEGGFTQFSLSQGVTALARQTSDYDRRVELERAGWEIISNDSTRLLEAGRNSARRKN